MWKWAANHHLLIQHSQKQPQGFHSTQAAAMAEACLPAAESGKGPVAAQVQLHLIHEDEGDD